jgi:hypothetical protein
VGTRMDRLYALLLSLAFTCTIVHAGDRELEVMIVDLTPSTLRDADQKQCLARFTHGVRSEARVHSVREADFRKRARKLDDASPFLGWKAPDVEGARILDQHTAVDSIVLVDCRPRDKRVDLLVVPNDSATVRMQLRERALTEARITTLATSAVRYSWVSFVP